MSVLRPRPPEDPLAYDGGGWSPGPLADRLAAIRDRLVTEPGALGLAPRTLEDYDTRRPASRLFAILTAARRIREAADRLVIVAGGSIGPATRLLAASCCHPFHDQLPRGERGGRPRLSWLDGRSGNDTLQGFFDVVAPPGGPRADDLLDRWAIMPVAVPPADPRQQIEAILLERLAASLGPDRARLAERVVPIAAGPGDAAALAERLRCPLRFTTEAGLGSTAGVFTAGGLLPASVAGIDVVQLLKGAAAMLRRFAEAPLAENPPVIDGAIAWEAARSGRATGRLFLGDEAWVSPLGEWHAAVRPAAPAAAALVTRIDSGEPRRERIVEPSPAEPATIGLPRVDEHALGQLLQLLILSAAVERELREAV